MNNNKLKHYGVLGMKWGRRKAKESPPKKKNKIEQYYIDKWTRRYENNGVNSEEAKLKAEKRAKIAKILAATAGITISAAAAYTAYNSYSKEKIDFFLEKGTTLHTISDDDAKDIQNRFFASYKKTDRLRYKGMYGGGQLAGALGNKIYDMKTDVTDRMKVASNKTARSVMVELYNKDQNFRTEFNKILNEYKEAINNGATVTNKQKKTIIKTVFTDKLDDRTSKKAYEFFNLAITHPDARTGNSYAKFFSALKNKGYGAIVDVNDTKLSGYGSNSPVIVFDNKKVKKIVNEAVKIKTKDVAGAMMLSDSGKTLAVSILGYIGAYELAPTESVNQLNQSTKKWKKK